DASVHARGKVVWISPDLDEKTRTVRVVASVVNPKGLLSPRTFGDGTITVRRDHQAVVVPNRAIQSEVEYEGAGEDRKEVGRHLVFVRQSGAAKDDAKITFEVRIVELGVRRKDTTEVRSGVKAGEVIVTTGSLKLKAELFKDRIGGD